MDSADTALGGPRASALALHTSPDTVTFKRWEGELLLVVVKNICSAGLMRGVSSSLLFSFASAFTPAL